MNFSLIPFFFSNSSTRGLFYASLLYSKSFLSLKVMVVHLRSSHVQELEAWAFLKWTTDTISVNVECANANACMNRPMVSPASPTWWAPSPSLLVVDFLWRVASNAFSNSWRFKNSGSRTALRWLWLDSWKSPMSLFVGGPGQIEGLFPVAF